MRQFLDDLAELTMIWSLAELRLRESVPMRKPLFPMTKAAVTVCSEITSPTSKRNSSR
jgi:hypothetical protein